jgi:hypothetical protein
VVTDHRRPPSPHLNQCSEAPLAPSRALSQLFGDLIEKSNLLHLRAPPFFGDLIRSRIWKYIYRHTITYLRAQLPPFNPLSSSHRPTLASPYPLTSQHNSCSFFAPIAYTYSQCLNLVMPVMARITSASTRLIRTRRPACKPS